MIVFQYHADIIERYPNIIGGVIHVENIENGPSSPKLQSCYEEEQKRTLERIGETPLSEIESIAAWRTVFHDLGVKPTQYRNAAEALLRRLTKHGDIPSINTFVDIANLVSIRYALPIAVFDTRLLKLPITVHFAEGDENFLPLGVPEHENPQPGEVVFSDEEKRVVARRWCWRQSDDSAARQGASKVIITIEGHHESARTEVEAARNDLISLLDAFSSGNHIAAILSAKQPSMNIPSNI
jgi:DNA/RNA-binding domain of Phe-tRNA-synthetase-like protein